MVGGGGRAGGCGGCEEETLNPTFHSTDLCNDDWLWLMKARAEKLLDTKLSLPENHLRFVKDRMLTVRLVGENCGAKTIPTTNLCFSPSTHTHRACNR